MNALTMDAMMSLRQAERKMHGAKHDLTRPDKHPNDAHKALAKIEEACGLIENAKHALLEAS